MNAIKTKDKIELACETFKKVNDSKVSKFNKLDDWLEKESSIFDSEVKNSKIIRYPNFKRGQIIKVDFGVNVGSELSHTHFAIVLNKDDTNSNITVMPITSKNGYKKISNEVLNVYLTF